MCKKKEKITKIEDKKKEREIEIEKNRIFKSRLIKESNRKSLIRQKKREKGKKADTKK